VANKHCEVRELLFESIQHALCVNAPFLPFTLFYPYSYGDKIHSKGNKLNMNWSEFPPKPLRRVIGLQELSNLCGVPQKIMSQSVCEASSHSSASGEDLMMREVNAWNSLAQVWQSFSKVNLRL
jgi:hypothetical protein